MSDTTKLWSVTTILGQGIPKPALVGWAAKVAGEYAVDHLDILAAHVRAGDRDGAIKLCTDARWNTTKRAQERGASIHEVAEQYALGNPVDVPAHLAPYIEHLRAFLADHRPTYHAAEAPVYNTTYLYAGTLDAIVEIDGSLCVLDIKTTEKLPGEKSRPPWPEVALQLCAYSRCEHVGLRGSEREDGRYGTRYYLWDDTVEVAPMPAVDGAFALVLSPGDYQLVPCRVDDQMWATFLYVREVARWSLETSRNALGKPVQQAVEA
ncbi:MAG: hypothetical protein ACKVWR_21820 [Acidimicrobiales bacterium]